MIGSAHLGGWTMKDNPTEIEKEAREVFQKATKLHCGVEFELCLQLGTQVVSGVNYAFICRSKSVALNPLTAYCLVICYADAENQCSITKIKEIVKDSECPIGGLHCTKISEAFIAKIDSIEADYIVKAFNQAFQNIKGVTYSPELLIAKQVATGLNCHFIAKAKIADEEGTINFKHVVINIFMNESKIVSIEHL